jgi:hypothetical protein
MDAALPRPTGFGVAGIAPFVNNPLLSIWRNCDTSCGRASGRIASVASIVRRNVSL